jgi:hypothetical protein
MQALQKVSGVGMVKIDSHWVNSYFRYEYLGDGDPPGREDELWAVRIAQADHRALDLRPDQWVRLRLPGVAEQEVCLRESWFQAPFVWLEFDRGWAAASRSEEDAQPVGTALAGS